MYGMCGVWCRERRGRERLVVAGNKSRKRPRYSWLDDSSPPSSADFKLRCGTLRGFGVMGRGLRRMVQSFLDWLPTHRRPYLEPTAFGGGTVQSTPIFWPSVFVYHFPFPSSAAPSTVEQQGHCIHDMRTVQYPAGLDSSYPVR